MHKFKHVKHHFPGAASRAQHRAGNDITERRNGDPYRVQPTHTSATPPCPSGYGNYVCSGTQTQTHAGQSRFRAKRVLPARRTPDITSTYGATGKCTPVAGQRATETASPGYECIRIFFFVWCCMQAHTGRFGTSNIKCQKTRGALPGKHKSIGA